MLPVPLCLLCLALESCALAATVGARQEAGGLHEEVATLRQENVQLQQDLSAAHQRIANVENAAITTRQELQTALHHLQTLESRLTSTDDRIERLEATTTAVGPVAFSVSSTTGQIKGDGGAFTFDVIHTNVGGGFVGPSDFICPASGWYLFATSMLAYVDNSVWPVISVNGVDGPNYFSMNVAANGGGVHFAYCGDGQRVSVINRQAGGLAYSFPGYSSFSGMLLSPDSPSE